MFVSLIAMICDTDIFNQQLLAPVLCRPTPKVIKWEVAYCFVAICSKTQKETFN